MGLTEAFQIPVEEKQLPSIITPVIQVQWSLSSSPDSLLLSGPPSFYFSLHPSQPSLFINLCTSFTFGTK